MKTNYAQQWKDAKTAFEQATNSKKPSPKETKLLVFTKRQGSGIEKVLKAFDTAMQKEHRKAAAMAYQKAWEVIGQYNDVLIKVSNSVDPSDPTFRAIQLLAAEAGTICSGGMASSLKALQKKKGKEVLVHPFLADIRGEEKRFTKAVKKETAAKKAESKHKVSKAATPILKCLEKYTQAASRGDESATLQALLDFDKLAKKFGQHCTTVRTKVNGDDKLKGFDSEVEKFANLVEQIRIGRANTQLNAVGHAS